MVRLHDVVKFVLAPLLLYSGALMADEDTAFASYSIRQFGSSGNERAYNTIVDSRGNQYITGFTSGDIDGDGPDQNMGSNDIFVVKLDRRGRRVWSRQLGSTEDDRAHLITMDSKGFLYVTGHAEGDLDGTGDQVHSGHGDPFLVKLHPNGEVIWIRQFGTPEDEFGFSVAIDKEDTVYVGGYTWGDMDRDGPADNAGLDDVYLVALDTDGNIKWIRQMGSEHNDVGYAITVDDEDGIYITGFGTGAIDTVSQQDNFGGWDLLAIKYNKQGQLQWARQYGTPGDDFSYFISANDDRLYITGFVSGDFDGSGKDVYMGDNDIIVLSLDPDDGSVLWSRQFGTEGTDIGFGVDASDEEGNVLITGTTTADLDGPGPQVHGGSFDVFAIHMENDGSEPMIKQWGSPTFDVGFIVNVLEDKAIITGETWGDLDADGEQTNHGGGDGFQIELTWDDEEDSHREDESEHDGKHRHKDH